MFYDVEVLSDENKCTIHTAWNFNLAWTYDWAEFCSEDCSMMGDVNNDFSVNVIDVLSLVCEILENGNIVTLDNGNLSPS